MRLIATTPTVTVEEVLAEMAFEPLISATVCCFPFGILHLKACWYGRRTLSWLRIAARRLVP